MLALAMCEQSPALEHALGPHLPRWLMAAVAVVATGDSWPMSWQQHIAHFLPDNPATFAPEGAVRGLEDAEGRHWEQLQKYFKSLSPPRPGEAGGRPPDLDEAALRQCYWDAYQKVLESDQRPKKVDVAALLLMSTKTLKRYRDRYNLPWPPLPPH